MTLMSINPLLSNNTLCIIVDWISHYQNLYDVRITLQCLKHTSVFVHNIILLRPKNVSFAKILTQSTIKNVEILNDPC